MLRPTSVCRSISWRSEAASWPCFLRTVSESAILPTSWSGLAIRTSSQRSSSRPEPPGKESAEATHPLDVACRLRVAELGRVGEAPSDLLAGVLKLVLRALQARDGVEQFVLRPPPLRELALRSRVEARVLDCDGGELAEAGEQRDLLVGEAARAVDVGETEHADDLVAGSEGHSGDGAQRQVVGVPSSSRPAEIVVHGEGLSARPDMPGDALAGADAVADALDEDAGAVADGEFVLSRLAQVEPAVRRSDEGPRSGDDRLEHAREVEALDQVERRLVQRSELLRMAEELFTRVVLVGREHSPVDRIRATSA